MNVPLHWSVCEWKAPYGLRGAGTGGTVLILCQCQPWCKCVSIFFGQQLPESCRQCKVCVRVLRDLQCQCMEIAGVFGLQRLVGCLKVGCGDVIEFRMMRG